ncbi:hypothetical protein CEXT_627041 [Caerostris extrusa]|uniref:Uncharacterized protein n=1 Tax=Caerostris extrusa TaxID=172846 RepID=A0AAV4VCK8_CAEEX|nr:hypothetical protein CEXT_627041 [Caerostris extrusa]
MVSLAEISFSFCPCLDVFVSILQVFLGKKATCPLQNLIWIQYISFILLSIMSITVYLERHLSEKFHFLRPQLLIIYVDN